MVKVFRETTSNLSTYGGLRVKRMTDYPTVPPGGVPLVRDFTYRDAVNSSLSSGVVGEDPIYNLSLTTLSGNATIYRSYRFNPITVSPLYYKAVKEKNAEFETNYKFTSHDQQNDTKGKWAYLIEPQSIRGGSSSYQEIGDYQSYDFMRTLSIETKIIANNGNVKQLITYTYLG